MFVYSLIDTRLSISCSNIVTRVKWYKVLTNGNKITKKLTIKPLYRVHLDYEAEEKPRQDIIEKILPWLGLSSAIGTEYT